MYLLGLFLLCQQALASEEQAEQPTLELLEFLGSAEMIDGKLLDPLHMADIEKRDLEARQQEEWDNE